MSNHVVRLSVAPLVLLASLFVTGFAAAWSGNVINSQGYATSLAIGAGTKGDSLPADDGGGCITCHGQNGTGPMNITINDVPLPATGPLANFVVGQGQTKTFTLKFEVGADKKGGGFLLMHDDVSTNDENGTLSNVDVDDSVHVCKGPSGSGSGRCNGTLGNNSEVTHEVPKDHRPGSAVVPFQFTYTANATSLCEAFTFGVWILATDHNLECCDGSDYGEFRRFQITTSCDDDNPCTNDACSATGCAHTNITGSCNDGRACTTSDTCTNGVCAGTARVCNDGIACTVDSCSEAANGCTVNASACECARDADCDDGNRCNGAETCDPASFTCRAGTPIDCSSPDASTRDAAAAGARDAAAPGAPDAAGRDAAATETGAPSGGAPTAGGATGSAAQGSMVEHQVGTGGRSGSRGLDGTSGAMNGGVGTSNEAGRAADSGNDSSRSSASEACNCRIEGASRNDGSNFAGATLVLTALAMRRRHAAHLARRTRPE